MDTEGRTTRWRAIASIAVKLVERIGEDKRQDLDTILDLIEPDSAAAWAAAEAVQLGLRDEESLERLDMALARAGFVLPCSSRTRLREPARQVDVPNGLSVEKDRARGRETAQRIPIIHQYIEWLALNAPEAVHRIVAAQAWESSLGSLRNGLLFHAEVLPTGGTDQRVVDYPQRLAVMQAYDWLCVEYGVAFQKRKIQEQARSLIRRG